MSTMGSSCSMQRQYELSLEDRARRRTNERYILTESNTTHNTMRHSVSFQLPDSSIAGLYPIDLNYVDIGHGHRSPKSLATLATEALCRSLPNFEGPIPRGIPTDVVDDIVRSLVEHSAFNESTLRILRKCELTSLSLARARGVCDDWFKGLCNTADDPIESWETKDDDDNENIEETGGNGGEDLFLGTFEAPSFDSSSSCESFATAQSKHGQDPANDLLVDSVEKQVALASAQMDGVEYDRDPKSELLVDTVKQQDGHESSHMDGMEISNGLDPFPPSDHCSYPSVTSNLTILDLRGSQQLTDRGLLHLTDLGQLEVALFDGCHGIVGRGGVALSSSHRLHTLSFANCRRLTDEAIINVSHLLSLETINLSGCRCLTDRSLAAIADMYALRRLDLSQCELITDMGIEQLEHLESLEELSLGWCRQISDRGIDCLSGHPGRNVTLRALRLARCPITDDGVRSLGTLLALEELDLNGCTGIKSQTLGDTLDCLKCLQMLDVSYCPGILRSSWQGKINALKVLDVRYSGVRDSYLTRWTKLPSLEELVLDSCPVGDWALSHLAGNEVVPNLVVLDLADSNVTDSCMPHIAKFTKLKKLSLFYCNITNNGLRHLAELVMLEELNLDSRDISDEGLRHLTKLENLKCLDVFSGRITDSGCMHISKVKSLEALDLCGGGITDVGCTHLATLENLKSLNLAQNERITNRGAAALAALSNLKALNLSNTRVTSLALRFFSGLIHLQSISLYGCRGVDQSVNLASLRCTLPNLKCVRIDTTPDDEGRVPSMSVDYGPATTLSIRGSEGASMEEDDTASTA